MEQCQDLCFQNPICTHFTFSSGTCYLKRNTGQFNEIAVTGPSCGFIRSRSSQIDGVPFNTNVVWNSGCDFSGDDIANQQITGVNYPDVCGNLCLNTAGCTSFTWNGKNGICFLKNFKPLPNPNLGFGNNVACGFIVDRVSSGSCDCKYQSKIGCQVSTPASSGLACKCNLGFFKCSPSVVPCLDFSSPSCRYPGTDLNSCLQGKDNCYGYSFPGSCSCTHHSGGCQVSQAAPPGLACACTNYLVAGCAQAETQCNESLMQTSMQISRYESTVLHLVYQK